MQEVYYAKIIYSQIVDLIEKLDKIELLISENNLKTINIGCPYEFFDTFLIDKISNLDFKINIEFGLTNDLIQKLRLGDLNIVIATQKISNSDFIYKEIFTETILLVGNKEINILEFNQFLYNQEYDLAEKWLSKLNCYAYSSDLPLIKRFWKNNFNKRPDNIVPKSIIPNLKYIVKAMIYDKCSFSLIPDYLCKKEIQEGLIKEIWQGKKTTTNKIYIVFNKDFEYEKIFMDKFKIE